MSKIERPDRFDVDAIRRDISQPVGADGSSFLPQPMTPELNPFARQIAAQFQAISRKPIIVSGQLRLFDFACLITIGLIIDITLALSPGMQQWGLLLTIVTGAGASVVLMQLMDCYHVQVLKTPLRAILRLLVAWTVPFIISALLILAFREDTPGLSSAVIVWYSAGAAFLIIERSLLGVGVRHWIRNGTMERRAVIVGGGQPAKDLIRAIEAQPDNDIRICGIFDDRQGARSPTVVAGYPKLGTFAELVEFSRLVNIDMLIISLPITAEARIMQLLRKLWVLPVDIRLAAHAGKLRFRPRAYSPASGVPMIDIFDKPIRDWDLVAKRLFDLTFTVIALLLLWPVMIGAAIAVKATSKGPVFFRQKRHGFNNEIINVWKFRSMYTDMSDPTARKAVSKNDPRVTPVGRFLRRSSLDELPQFFNVLRGDLSLVGPRPHAVHAQTGDLKYPEVVESYFARHRVKPGVTGWAQINGWRGEIDNSDKIRFRTAYDLYYIENWSLYFDLKILFLTPIRLLKSDNAY